MSSSQLTAEELFGLCARRDDTAWGEFHHRYRRLLLGVMGKEASRFGIRETDAVADLEQSFYLKLLEKDGHVLRLFEWRGEGSDFRYLKTVAVFYVHDKATRKAPATVPLEYADLRPVRSQTDPLDHLDAARIDAYVRLSFNERDYKIFRLRHFTGLTAKQISVFASLGLEEKGVEAVLKRIMDKLKGQFGPAAFLKSVKSAGGD